MSLVEVRLTMLPGACGAMVGVASSKGGATSLPNGATAGMMSPPTNATAPATPVVFSQSRRERGLLTRSSPKRESATPA